MAKIDDPLGQTEFVNHEEPTQGLAVVINAAAPIVALFSSPAGAFTALVAYGLQFVSQHQREARAAALQDGFKEAFFDLKGKVEAIEKKVSGPDAEEAVATAAFTAMRSARLDKARMFGRVLGGTVADDPPRWQEATAFIRALEQFGDEDLKALIILWTVQAQSYRISGTPKGMSTDANDYTKTWSDVVSAAEKQGLSKDEWYSTCARLSGFGLTVMVQPNTSFQGPDAICFRLTGRAVRLQRLLGRNVDPGSYPAWRYHPQKEAVIVKDEDEDKNLGAGWFSTPAAFPKSKA